MSTYLVYYTTSAIDLHDHFSIFFFISLALCFGVDAFDCKTRTEILLRFIINVYTKLNIITLRYTLCHTFYVRPKYSLNRI